MDQITTLLTGSRRRRASLPLKVDVLHPCTHAVVAVEHQLDVALCPLAAQVEVHQGHVAVLVGRARQGVLEDFLPGVAIIGEQDGEVLGASVGIKEG